MCIYICREYYILLIPLPIVLPSVFCSSLICRMFVIYDVSCVLDACLPQAVAREECCLASGGVDVISKSKSTALQAQYLPQGELSALTNHV